jgi:hypothetical protein
MSVPAAAVGIGDPPSPIADPLAPTDYLPIVASAPIGLWYACC